MITMKKPRNNALLKISGILLVILACITAPLWGIATIRGFINHIGNFQSVNSEFTGQHFLNFEEKHYVIYYEQPNSTLQPQGLAISVSNYAHVPLSIKTYSSSVTYNYGNHHGVAIASFDVHKAGRYVLTVVHPTGNKGKIVIGESVESLFTHYVLRGVLGAFLLFFGLGGAGAFLLTLSDKNKTTEKS